MEATTTTSVLSDDEIGALFEAVKSSDVESGEEEGTAIGEEPALVPFQPRALEAEAADMSELIERVHGVLAIEVGAALSAVLRLPVKLELGPPAEPGASPATGSGAQVLLAASGSLRFGSLLVPEELVRAAADRMLGGAGVPAGPGRPISELEKRVAARPLEALAAAVVSAWRPWISAEVTAAVHLDGRPRPVTGPVVACSLRMTIGTAEVAGAMFYPLGPLRQATEWASGAVPAAAAVAADAGGSLAARLETLPLKVAVRAPGFVLSVGEMLALVPGHSLAIGRLADLRVEIAVEDRPRLRGKLIVDGTGARTVAVDEQIQGYRA